MKIEKKQLYKFDLEFIFLAGVVGIRTHVVLTHTSFGDWHHRPLGDTPILQGTYHFTLFFRGRIQCNTCEFFIAPKIQNYYCCMCLSLSYIYIISYFFIKIKKDFLVAIVSLRTTSFTECFTLQRTTCSITSSSIHGGGFTLN